MNSIVWDKIRVLVTNGCNYRCPFCHNEGQAKDMAATFMSFEEFKQLVDLLKDQPISEFNISGGEPFLHKDIVKMIVLACSTLKCDISCATNLSLINDAAIRELSDTRVKFNIQFPYVSESLFAKSTGTGSLPRILDKINMVKSSGIEIGLNSVIQTSDKHHIVDLIEFALQSELPLKLLPQLGSIESIDYKSWVYPILSEYAIEKKDKGTGAIKWIIQKDNNRTSVLYIDSPCFSHNISICRSFGEIRIHPGLYAQTCIEKDNLVRLEIEKGSNFVLNQFKQLWNNFTKC